LQLKLIYVWFVVFWSKVKKQLRVIRIYQNLGKDLGTDLLASNIWLKQAECWLFQFKSGKRDQILEKELNSIYLGKVQNLVKSFYFKVQRNA
jgi:hypothetical protein